jgi:hypothetical protein
MSRTPFRVPFRILLKICLFIDGIDEFEEDPTQLAELFLSLSSFPNIKFAIAGRRQCCIAFDALRRAQESVAGEGITPVGLGRSPRAHPGSPKLTWFTRGQGGEAHPPERDGQQGPSLAPRYELATFHFIGFFTLCRLSRLHLLNCPRRS